MSTFNNKEELNHLERIESRLRPSGISEKQIKQQRPLITVAVIEFSIKTSGDLCNILSRPDFMQIRNN